MFQPIARGGQVGIHLASEREAKPFAIFQIEAYAAQQCAEKDKQLKVLGKLYKEEGTRFNKARDDSFKLKAERDQAIADVKRLREALERALSYVGHEGDSVALSETLAATDKPEYE